MNKLAIETLAMEVRNRRVAALRIEREHMSPDCKFDSQEMEFDYARLGSEAGALELFCCRTWEEAEYFGKCYAELVSPREYLDAEEAA